MYSINVSVEGIAPLLQNKHPLPDYATIRKGGKQSTGEIDYSQELKEYLYVTPEGEIFQPAVHFDAAMTKAAENFKIQGKRGKTYKDMFKGNVFCSPDEILHGINAPDELDTDADKPLYLDILISRARVVRIRPVFSPGWKLDFDIEVIDDQLPVNVLNEVLVMAGKTVGIGDFRPKFGRFMVTKFEVKE